MKKIVVLFLGTLSITAGAPTASPQQLVTFRQVEVDSLITLYQYENDTLFGVAQSFSWVAIPKAVVGDLYSMTLAWEDSLLIPTSVFGLNRGASVALNGGFFHTTRGGSVTFLESDGIQVSNRSYDPTIIRDPNPFNGALVFDWHGRISIEPCQNDSTYLHSSLEQTVLITGPMLLHNGSRCPLPETSFSIDRHPRSCIGITDRQIVILAVDGRAKEAPGMSLAELQEVMLRLQCMDAVNLDGGGSTTLWLNTPTIQGIVNHPSDNRKFDHQGERRVANAILITKRLK